VIYWAWSNTLSLGQQYFIMKRQGVEVHLAGNVSRQLKSLKEAPAQVSSLLRQLLGGGASSGAGDSKGSDPTKTKDDDKA
jgi:membrane protein insertase Oxa1/YidC/SpoIIIJ